MQLNLKKLKNKEPASPCASQGGPTLSLSKEPASPCTSQGGFTLIETLISLFIFSSFILATYFLSGDNINNINYVRNKLIASYLSVEGIEFIRNSRDSFVLFDELGWATFNEKVIEKCKVDNNYLSPNVGCYFDTQTFDYDQITKCNNSCPNLHFNNGTYNYDLSGEITSFKRVITIEEVENVSFNKEIKVSSSIYWTVYGKNYKLIFTDYLKNWQEN